MAQPEDLSEGPKILRGLSPTEIVAMHGKMREWQFGLAADAEPPRQYLDLQQLVRKLDLKSPIADLTESIESLAETDPPRLGAITAAFVNSPVFEDRLEAAAYLIDHVSKVLPATGSELWGRLLRDGDERIRRTASAALDLFVGCHHYSNSVVLEKTGLSGEQYDQLFIIQAQAEQGEDLIVIPSRDDTFDLGALVARKVLVSQGGLLPQFMEATA
ncbi:MAG TPA: hypothetical protein VLG11_00470 [Candidatus Saccharimonadales bacterium]|nr:hypothetical protein [Candidatus Saccharimonadales bacterium]